MRYRFKERLRERKSGIYQSYWELLRYGWLLVLVSLIFYWLLANLLYFLYRLLFQH